MPVRIIQGGRPPHAPQRETSTYPMWNGMFGRQRTGQSTPKPTPSNLSRFAEHPVIRRAINAIKNPVAGLEWHIIAAEGLEMTPDMEKRAAIAAHCLRNPNGDDSFRSLVEQIIDDTLTFAGAVEMQTGGDPSKPLWLYPVDGSSVRLYPAWTGKANEPRYAQYTGYSGGEVPLLNDELMYIRMNPRTSTPFGFTPVECAFNLINAFISAFEFAQKLAGNATPAHIIDWGPNAKPEFVAAMRTYWQDSVEGQGEIPMVGGWANPNAQHAAAAQILRLSKGDDTDLRLSWQQWIVRLTAIAFDISPQKLGLETNVNRATGEVMSEADDEAAIKPMARLIAEYLTREAIGRKLGWYDLRFEFVGLTPEDDLSRSEEWKNLDASDVVVPDELRKEKGLPPLPGGWGQLTNTQRKIRIMQARGAKSETQDPGTEDVTQPGDPATLNPNRQALPGDPEEE